MSQRTNFWRNPSTRRQSMMRPVSIALLLGALLATMIACGASAATVFTKIANNGNALPESAVLGAGPTDWACTRHNPTGLVFEVKLDAVASLRHADHTYSWLSNNSASNGGMPGTAAAGACAGAACDTQSFVAAVNGNALCGFSNWRLPTRKELQLLLDNSPPGTGAPVVGATYFANMRSAGYWSADNFAGNAEAAWSVHFDDGRASWRRKSLPQRILLVR